MIHIKEIRFGNRAQTRDGEIITVQQILSDSIICEVQVEHATDVVHSVRTFAGDNMLELMEEVKEFECRELYPIPLSPEILKKCGFRNFTREEWIISIGNSHIDFVFIEDALRLRCPAPSLRKIKYVHQLQNLLFEIAEFELEVEL